MKTNQSQKNNLKEWQEFSVNDIFSFIKTYAFSRDNLINGVVSNKDIGNIHYGDIHSKFTSPNIDLNNIEIPIIKDENFKPKKEDLLRNGDLIIADASEDYEGIGVCVSVHGLNNNKVVGGLHTYVLRDRKGITNEYFRQFIFRNPIVRNKLQKVANGVSVYGISKKEIAKIKLSLPPLPEQNRIFSVLETWDKAIEKLNKKIEIKKQIKKSLMQDLLTGKKRLDGFSDRWKLITLGSVGEIVTGNTPPMKDRNNYGETYCWATAEDFNGKYINNTRIKLSEGGKKISRFLPKGSILVTCIASIGKNAIAGVSLATNQQINSVIVNKKNNNEFIYYVIQNSKNLLKRFAGAGAMSILNKITFSKIKILIPELGEQNAIVEILTTADKEITELERKLEIIKDQKKYLLNNLITGAIRTPENLKIKKLRNK